MPTTSDDGMAFMKSALQILIGLFATMAVAVLWETKWFGQAGVMFVVAALALTSAVAGTRLPLSLKAFATTFILYFGYAMCLVGRTMQPGGFTGYTFGMALQAFFMFAALPTVSLLRLWPRRMAVALVVAAFPLSLIGAAGVAGIEERLFVQKYRDSGVGPTARWTVSSHWLSYDRETHRLSGSD